MCKYKTVCFIGHRKIEVTKKLTDDLTASICNLIQDGICNFIFGSHSQFDDLCYQIVTEQQKQYPQIKRIHYCTAYENYSNAGLNNLYEQEIDCESSLAATKNTYIVRNQAMIDNSDVCVFYYDKNYQPPQHKNSKYDLTSHQSQSGTAIAFQYAKNKNKIIINIGEQNELD